MALKVKFIYRNYRPIHSTFQSIMDNPPEGVTYTTDPVKKQPGFLFRLYRQYGSNPVIRFIIHKFQKLLFRQGAEEAVDILHVVDVILEPRVRSTKPYIVDIGHVGALASHTGLNDSIIRDIKDYLFYENCKGIIARSQAAASSLYAIFTDNEQLRIKEKVTVVHPAYTPTFSKEEVWQIKKKILTSSEINLLFIGNFVHGKGLREVIDAFIKLREVNGSNIQLTVIANDYEEVTKLYDSSQLDGVTCHQATFSIEELIRNFYLKSHIFVLPSHHEILGMVFLESLSTATPVIAINQYSTPEVVRDGYNGYLLTSENTPFSKKNPLRKDFDPKNFYESEQKVVEQLVEKIKMLIEDRSLLEKLSAHALSSVYDEDTFSVAKRNERLKNLYDKAIS